VADRECRTGPWTRIPQGVAIGLPAPERRR
jgi:hypothetical protein